MVYDISKDGKTILCSPGEDYAHQQDLFKVYRYTK